MMYFKIIHFLVLVLGVVGGQTLAPPSVEAVGRTLPLLFLFAVFSLVVSVVFWPLLIPPFVMLWSMFLNEKIHKNAIPVINNSNEPQFNAFVTQVNHRGKENRGARSSEYAKSNSCLFSLIAD